MLKLYDCYSSKTAKKSLMWKIQFKTVTLQLVHPWPKKKKKKKKRLMRDSAQNMDRKSNLKSVIKAQTSFLELVHMTEKKEHICWELSETFSARTQQLLLRQVVPPKIINFYILRHNYSIHCAPLPSTDTEKSLKGKIKEGMCLTVSHNCKYC